MEGGSEKGKTAVSIPSRRLLQSYRWDGGPVSMRSAIRRAVSRTQESESEGS